MFDSVKLKAKSSSVPAADPPVTPGKAPTKKQIYRSRQNHGVNIGACFVQESWIYSDLFSNGADCELQAVQQLVKSKGEDETRKKFENHWKGFLNDDNWKWMQDHKVTSIRVPMGYWEFGSDFASGTKFSKYTGVYKNAWSIFKKYFVEAAAKYDIAVLFDLHGVPGGANGADHSGESSGGEPKFWNDSSAQLQMCDLLEFVAKELKDYENIAGIEVINESVYSSDGKSQAKYYAAAISSIRKQDTSIPILISDGWYPNQWVKWVQSIQSGNKYVGVVIDSHCYRCFSDSDKNKSAEQIIKDLNGDELTNLNDNGDGVDILVGEYSCVIDTSSWNKDNNNSKRDELVVKFGKEQSKLFAKRASIGSYFWTFKFQSGNGGEWDFKTMTNKGALPTSDVIIDKIPSDTALDAKFESDYSAHIAYWEKQNPTEKYQHYRYSDGYKTALEDSKSFAKFNGSSLGSNQFWKNARLKEHIKEKGNSHFLWEWNQGFDAGLSAFKNT